MSQFAVVIAFAFASTTMCAAAQLPAEARKIDTGLGDFRVAFKVLQDCSKSQFGPCIKHKLLTALDRINEQPEVELFDGVRLVKDPAAARNDVVQDPPSARSADADGNAGLDALVVDKVVNFFKSRSLQFKLLDGEPKEIADGRKKSNKYSSSLLMYPFMMGGMTIPLAFGVLALLAGKALIIAKLALALSAIVGLKKLFSDHGSSHEYITHGGGGHYRRSLPGEPVAAAAAAANMAYSSYMPVYEEPIRSTTTNAIPM